MSEEALNITSTNDPTKSEEGLPTISGKEYVNKRILQRTCLNPCYSLRRQLFLSFGMVGAGAILFLMLAAIISILTAGNAIQWKADVQVEKSLRSSSRYVAETITKKFENWESLASIMAEMTLDRMAGYPDYGGYEDDSNVPFFDLTTGKNSYPIKSSSLLPLDWQMEVNVNDSNYMEHIQYRYHWYGKGARVSTVSATFRMQGQCDPSVTDEKSPLFYRNCTDANNDILSGGAVRPTKTNHMIARKAADLSFVLKPLYEYHQEAMVLAIFFANSGAGCGIAYPGRQLNSSVSYTSIGCDWMARPSPKNTSMPLASPQEIDRCHLKGERVPGREYNFLERGWCRDQALNPDKPQSTGPYVDAWKENLWLMTFGKAVYDRVTKKFIGCTLVDVAIDQITDIFESVSVWDTSDTTLVRWNDGTVVASSRWDHSSSTETVVASELGFGLGIDEDVFQEMKSKVDFSSRWNPEDIRDSFENSFFHGAGKLVTVYPVPVPPKEYDETYHPEYMVIMSIDEETIYGEVWNMSEAVQHNVMGAITFILVFGFIGLTVLMTLIVFLSDHLTKPLKWMEEIGKMIADNFAFGLSHGLDRRGPPIRRCSPETEITALVKEFQKMVHEFSGKGTAVVVKEKIIETKNPFDLSAEFQDLYQSRQEKGYKYAYGDSPNSGQVDNGKSTKVVDLSNESNVPPRKNRGPNVHFGKDDISTAIRDAKRTEDENSRLTSSPLFKCIVGLLATPVMLTMISISILVVVVIVQRPPTWLSDVKKATSENARSALMGAAVARARFASESMKKVVRDLHVHTRVAGWLLFDALERSDSFTEQTTGAEQCKVFPANGSCVYLSDKIEAPCDCDWADSYGKQCHSYDHLDTRFLQKIFYEGQSQDVDVNGDRNSTSFPKVGQTPELTAWWDDLQNVPGREKGALASGYETTYDRFRVMSAMSAVDIPLYNYEKKDNTSKNLGTLVGFEADGSYVGYAGCSHGHAELAHWQSTLTNGAYKLDPNLCPLHKYGYDSRCRTWYVHARDRYKEGFSPLHVTPPYVFASSSSVIAQSCSIPLIDPQSNKTVGVSLVDFLPGPILESLRRENTELGPSTGGFPILITAEVDNFGSDTVVGPGFALDGSAVPIADLVLPYDCRERKLCQNRLMFEAIVKDMRAKKTGEDTFTRTTKDGNQENMFVAYAPVRALSLRAKDHSDFSRGVDQFDSLIFSLALAVPESNLLLFFSEIERDLYRVLYVSVAVFITLIVVTLASVVLISDRITVSVTVPVKQLLSMVQDINRHKIPRNFTACEGGSRETKRVRVVFEKLFLIIQVANSAFFSGDVKKCYMMLVDALATFIQLQDMKAIGIANNNLGIAMLTTYEIKSESGRCGILMSNEQIVANGVSYFDNAIKSGEEALDKIQKEVGWSNEYLIFMQQLSNRYFNRAIFLLTVKSDHPQPHQAEDQGQSDLMVAKDMDIEVVDQRAQWGLKGSNEERFDLILGRLHGLIRLMQMSYSDEWGIEELFDDALMQLSDALENPEKNDLFRKIGPAGRMQQLEAALLQFIECTTKDVTERAKVGIRMLVEDEYVQPEAASESIKAIMSYIRSRTRLEGASPETLGKLRKYLDMLQRAQEPKRSGVRVGSRAYSLRKMVSTEAF